MAQDETTHPEPLELLSKEEVQRKLLAERRKIPELVDQLYESFLEAENQRATWLVRAVEKFEDPEEGFRIMKEYYETGDTIRLRKRIMEADLVPSQDEEGTVHHMHPQHTRIYGSMYNCRQFLDPIEQADHPIRSAAHPMIAALYEERLMSSLDGLRAQANHPLIARDALFSYRDQSVASLEERFDNMAKELLSPPINTRQRLTILPEAADLPLRFGVEIEGFFRSGQTIRPHLKAAREALQSAGLDVGDNYGAKTDTAYAQWQTVSDYSIRNPLRIESFLELYDWENTCTEIVTPILEGQAGIRDLAAAIQALQVNGYETNQSCGLHVHVGLEGTTLEQRKNLAKAFIRNEAAIDQLVDGQRRGNQNPFAKSMQDVSMEAIDAAENISELVEAVTGGYPCCKLDLTGLDLPGSPETVQYRGEGGHGCLDQAPEYVMAMLNFTHRALDNPEVTLDEVLADISVSPSKVAALAQQPKAPQLSLR